MTERKDVLIIGGGAIGVCAAYYLAEEGLDVALIEREDICSGSSYGNAGLIAVDHAIPTAAPGALSQGVRWLLDPSSPFSIRPRPDPDLVRWLWRFRAACQEAPMRRAIPLLLALARASLDLYEQLHRQHNLNDGYRFNGRILLYRDEAGLEHAIEELHLLEEYGVRGDVLDNEHVRAMVPRVRPTIAGGLYYPGYAHLVPGRFVLDLADVVRSLGVEFHTHTEVESFETSGKQITRVLTTNGAFHADEIILAAGVWSAPIARRLDLRLPVQAAKGYSITAKLPPDVPDIPMSLGEAKVAVTPMGEFLRFSSTLEMSGFDMSINQRRVSATRAALREYLSGMESLEELELWRGLRPMTPDSLPLLGRSAAIQNLVIATGHGMLGLTQGPITGKLAMQIITDASTDIDLAPLRPDRFE